RPKVGVRRFVDGRSGWPSLAPRQLTSIGLAPPCRPGRGWGGTLYASLFPHSPRLELIVGFGPIQTFPRGPHAPEPQPVAVIGDGGSVTHIPDTSKAVVHHTGAPVRCPSA